MQAVHAVRRGLGLFLFLVLGAGFALAQGGGAPAQKPKPAEEGGIEVNIGGEGRADSGTIEIKVDPFEESAPGAEPNRPKPIRVGVWPAPELDRAATLERASLLAAANAHPDDPGAHYHLAEFYLRHRWFPHAEKEFFTCSRLEPGSIRPWEGLLRVYRERPRGAGMGETIRIAPAGVRVVVVPENPRGEADWLASLAERNRRITFAYRQIVRLRPDDVARRREFLAHLKRTRDYPEIEVQARAILERMPDDVTARYDLSEAVRVQADRANRGQPGSGEAGIQKAIRLLEENLKRDPGHARSALRLARLLAVRKGAAAEKRIVALESRGLFELFVRGGIASIPFKTDTWRMVRDLIGPRMANRLWDDAMTPPSAASEQTSFDQSPPFIRHWVFIHFPHAQIRDRLAVVQRLGRHANRDAAAVLLNFLRHLQGPSGPESSGPLRNLEQAAVEAAARAGAVVIPMAQRFLALADTPALRRRAVLLAGALDDPALVRGLIDALGWETNKQVSYGVAAALERLHDPQAIDALADAALDTRRPLPRRREAAAALGTFRDPRSIETLRRLATQEGFTYETAFGLFNLAGDGKAYATLRAGLLEGGRMETILPLLARCTEPRTGPLLLDAFANCPAGIQPAILELLKKRFWKTARNKVKAILLARAGGPGLTEFVLRELAAFSGSDVADRLLPLMDSLKGKRWALAARALAHSGDMRAVRYFRRTRILSKDPGVRRLAKELSLEAEARRLELAHGAATKSGG